MFDDLKMEDDIPIFNYVSSCQKPITNCKYKIIFMVFVSYKYNVFYFGGDTSL